MRLSLRLSARVLSLACTAILTVFGASNLFAAAPCALNPQNKTVTICTPTNASRVDPSVNIVAGATDRDNIKGMQVFVDGVKVYEARGNQVNTRLMMKEGTHRVSVQAVDAKNAVFKSAVYVTAGAATAGSLASVKHIFFFIQENRSFDSHFGMLGAYRAKFGYPGTINGVPLTAALPDKSGTATVHPFHYQTVCTEEISPSWNEAHGDIDKNKMDRFMQTQAPTTIDPQNTRVMGHYDQTDLPYYYELASQYGTSDTFFSPLLANTIPNRMYDFAASSFGHIRPDTPPAGGWTNPTIFRLLSQHHITWRYYYQDNSVFLSSFTDGTTYKGLVYPISAYYRDINTPTMLPQVLFIERGSATGLDEHPTANLQKGAADSANIINAFLHSQVYSDSVFILTYDEGGGLYDHVPPFTEVAPDSIAPMLKPGDAVAGFTTSGFRLPLIVISPWSKRHFVSHVNRDTTAILKFIETRFALGSLTKRDAAQDPMLEFFDFTAPQIPTPPTLPVQPTNGVCSQKLEKAPGF